MDNRRDKELQRLRNRIRELEGALQFYADRRRYCYDEDGYLVHEDDPTGITPPEVVDGVLDDRGVRAVEVLATPVSDQMRRVANCEDLKLSEARAYLCYFADKIETKEN